MMITETPNAYSRNNTSGFDYIFLHRQRSSIKKDTLGKHRYQSLSDPNIFQLFKKILENDSVRPIFLYVHMKDPHYPFQPSLEILNKFLKEGDEKRMRVTAMKRTSDPKDIDYFRRLYQASVMQADKNLSTFLESARHISRLQKSYLILTADHGELLYEDKKWGHGWNTDHDALIHVPYIWIDREKTFGIKRKEPVKLTDTYPSLLSLCDFNKDSDFPFDGMCLFGRSLATNISPKRHFILNDYRTLHSAILQDGKKYPLIAKNISGSFSEKLSPEINQEIARILDERRKKRKKIRIFARKEKLRQKKLTKKQSHLLDPNALEILKSLGYIK
jgi:membrane-anchored protein YejM (alkaline phosphatase superfamily)